MVGQSTLIPTETALDRAPGVVQLKSDCKAAWREKEYKNACNSILIKCIYSWNCHHRIFKHSKVSIQNIIGEIILCNLGTLFQTCKGLAAVLVPWC